MKITDKDYEKYAIIKPPNNIDEKKITRIIIDSSSRDKTLFPNPNNYQIDFEDDINDVIKAKLIYFDSPDTNYLINDNFNIITVVLSSTEYIIQLSSGSYTTSELNTEIQNKLNIALGSGVITSTYNSIKDKYIFTSSGAFTINFLNVNNNVSALLGFENKNYNATLVVGSYTVEAPYRKNFEYNNYIVMYIDQFDLLKSINSNLNKSFAVIPKQYNALKLNDDIDYIKNFNPYIPKLTKLRIKFYDKYGNPYDFQNMDHRFEIELKSFKQSRKYNDIFND